MNEIKGFFGAWRFLSNFHFTPVEYEGLIFKTTEHAYQAAKFVDIEKQKYIQSLETPKEARRVGQQEGIRLDWDSLKYQVMFDLNLQKYSRPKERDMLLQTGEAYLEETNTWNDRYWGVCKGEGQNNLGKILMDIRALIRQTG